MAEHTAEPWKQLIEGSRTIVDGEGFSVAECKMGGPKCFPMDAANARRIVLCVNALQGIPTAELEALAPGALQGVFDKWRHERNK